MREFNNRSLPSVELQSGKYSWSCVKTQWMEQKCNHYYTCSQRPYLSKFCFRNTSSHIQKVKNKIFTKPFYKFQFAAPAPTSPKSLNLYKLEKAGSSFGLFLEGKKKSVHLERKWARIPLRHAQYISRLLFHHKCVVGYHSRSHLLFQGLKF